MRALFRDVVVFIRRHVYKLDYRSEALSKAA
jgi:hypothetical protein